MKNKRTALYRHFDACGRLLYVGISLSAVHRLEQHRSHAHWFRDIARVDVQWLPSRDAAMKAEAAAIGEERPAFNVVRPGQPRTVIDQPTIDSLRPAGVIHPMSGRVDGWYARGIYATEILGWFRAMFPKDRFDLLTAADAKRIGFLSSDLKLSSIEWQRWASTEPDFKAADKYDEMLRA